MKNKSRWIKPASPISTAWKAINRKKWPAYLSKLMFLTVIALIIWLPILATIFTSFKLRSEIAVAIPTLLPQSFSLDNYERLFRVMRFDVYLWNSLLVASCTSAISLLASSLAAYALVWFKFRGKSLFQGFTLFVYLFPQILLAIPLFLMCYRLQLLDTKFALVLTYLAFILPFGIWMLKNYFESISGDLVDAALVDGCSYWQCLLRVVLPVCLPGMATVLTYSFILAWNEFMFANILISSNSNRTVSIGVQTLVSNHGTDFSLLTAAAVVMIIPTLIFFISVQRWFIEGLTLGGARE
jgi:multiple sugar transport system permease protein